MRLPLLVSGFAFVGLLTACGEDASPSATSGSAAAPRSAAPAATTKASGSAGTTATASTAAASSTAAPSAAGEAKEISVPDLTKLLKLPEGSAQQKVAGMEGFHFMGPKDSKLTDVGAGGRTKKWGTTSFGGMTMATLLANHEQDEGEKCMKLADAKAKLQGAKIVREASHTSEPEKKGETYTDWGEKLELVVFERDGKQGFYAHKEFNHGDDSTHVCCTAGAAADAKDLKGTAEPAQIDQMSSVCWSWTFSF